MFTRSTGLCANKPRDGHFRLFDVPVPLAASVSRATSHLWEGLQAVAVRVWSRLSVLHKTHNKKTHANKNSPAMELQEGLCC